MAKRKRKAKTTRNRAPRAPSTARRGRGPQRKLTLKGRVEVLEDFVTRLQQTVEPPPEMLNDPLAAAIWNVLRFQGSLGTQHLRAILDACATWAEPPAALPHPEHAQTGVASEGGEGGENTEGIEGAQGIACPGAVGERGSAGDDEPHPDHAPQSGDRAAA